MDNSKIGGQGKEKEWKEKLNEEVMKRVADFMKEDDEAFFQRTIQGLDLEEIEAFLEECPELRRFWNKENEDKEK